MVKNLKMTIHSARSLWFALAFACTPKKPEKNEVSKTNAIDFLTAREIAPAAETPDCKEDEADRIFSLLAFAVVQKDWQEEGNRKPRGHNIGGILVETIDKVVKNRPQDLPKVQRDDICKKATIGSYKIRHWARNSNHITCNGTNHGEVRLMTQYLGQVDRLTQGLDDDKELSGFTIYTTLEPCVMCSGMMMQQSVDRTVYGQTDFDFGKAIERMSFDFSQASDSEGRSGFKPFPRLTQSEASKLPLRFDIDKAYLEVNPADGDRKEGMTSFLRSGKAKAFYDRAVEELKNYKLHFPENASVLADAQKYLAEVVPVLDPLLDPSKVPNEIATKECKN